MAWFWQRKTREKEQRDAQAQAVSQKRSMFASKDKPATKTAGKFKGAQKDSAKVGKAATKGSKAGAQMRQITGAKTYGILLGPIVTEKAARLAESGTFVFAVTPTANKIDIARAVASLYKVHPVDVSVVNGHAKPKMFAQRAGRRSSKRKAYVTLAQGEHIDFFEGQR